MVVAPQEKERQRAAPRLDAAFLAQLLATRDPLPGPRRATATRAYAATRASTIRRLPAGYRRTLDA